MKLQDYLHYYMGATFWTDNSQGEVNPETLRFIYPMIEKNKGVQLHLRRLEDMTEKEMIGMMQATVPDDMDKEDRPCDDEYIINMFYADGGNLVDERVAVGAEVTLRCFEGQVSIWKCGTIYMHDDAGEEQFRVNDPRAFHYLLQQHFDLFGLIDAGRAVDIKTITK